MKWFYLLAACAASDHLAGQQIRATIANIPGAATRAVVVVDGGALTTAIRRVADFLPATASAIVTVPVPAGGPYRVRTIAFVAGLSIPRILRTGKVAGVNVPSGTVSVQANLADPGFAKSASVPGSVQTGAAVSLGTAVTDAGDFCDGGYGHFWISPTAFTANMLSSTVVGAIPAAAGAGVWQVSATVNAWTSPGSLYFQTGVDNASFSTVSEVPMLFWPNLPGPTPLPQVLVTSGPTLSVTVTNLPTAATRVVVVVDVAAGTTWRTAKAISSGTSSTVLTVGLPAGGPYRLRAIAFTAGSLVPPVLRSGKVVNLSFPATTTATIALSDITGTVSSNPATGRPGATVDFTVKIADAGDFLEGGFGHIRCASAYFSQNLLAADCASGPVTQDSPSSYTFAATVALASQPGLVHFQSTFHPTAFDQAGETPELFLPNVQTASPWQFTISTASNVRGDFDGDGKIDLIWANDSTRQAALWYMDGALGDHYKGFGWLTSSGVPGWRIVAVADLDGDGKTDLIWQNDATRQVAVWYMTGVKGDQFRAFGWLQSSDTPGWSVVGMADLDGNGKLDLIWQSDTNRQVAAWYMGGANGDQFQSFGWLQASDTLGWRVVGMTDLDGNGKPDLVWQNDANRHVLAWLMGGAKGDQFQGLSWLQSSDTPGWSVVGLVDLDGNGKADLIWQNDATRQLAAWFMGGAQGVQFQSFGWLEPNGVAGWHVVTVK